MKPMTLTEVQSTQISLLQQLKAICTANGLRYALAGGTLLGAVRHGGYIPWDDDIDVLMPRPDYERFVTTVFQEGSGRIFTHETRPDYYYPFAKLIDPTTLLIEQDAPPIKGLGVNIDVVPVDGYPQGRARRMAAITIAKYGWRFSLFDNVMQANSPLKQAVKIRFARLCRYQGWQPWLKRLTRLLAAQPFEESPMAGFPLVYGSREILPRSVYETYTQLSFEGELYAAPAAYETYLAALYGDFLTLPLPEKRHSHHHYQAFFKDMP
jgi:LPS biosynthesis protein